jgi:hypothetical protein
MCWGSFAEEEGGVIAWITGLVFAILALVFWDDENFRRLHILLANIWWAAAYIRFRLDRA